MAGRLKRSTTISTRPVEDRIRVALPDTCTFGENLSKHTTIDYSLGDLMMSEGHRANLLSDRFTLIGIGIVRGEDGFLYITQEFARPCDPPPKGSKRRKNLPQEEDRARDQHFSLGTRQLSRSGERRYRRANRLRRHSPLFREARELLGVAGHGTSPGGWR